jgi:hypothetical protein
MLLWIKSKEKSKDGILGQQGEKINEFDVIYLHIHNWKAKLNLKKIEKDDVMIIENLEKKEKRKRKEKEIINMAIRT